MTVPKERTSLIISAWPNEPFRENRPHGFFTMEGAPKCTVHRKAPCPVCKPVAKLIVKKAFETTDIGDDRRMGHTVDDQDLANDLARGVKHFGVLACEGEEPTQEEITTAYANLEAYLKMVKENEDRVFGATGRHYNLSHAQIAVEYFGETRTWSSESSAKTPCPACGTPNLVSTARCLNVQCGAVLNWEKARELGVLRPDQIEMGLATGKLARIPGLDPEPVASTVAAADQKKGARPLAGA